MLYTIVIKHHVIKPQYFTPQRNARTRTGELIPSKYTPGAWVQEDIPREEIYSACVERWITRKSELDALSSSNKYTLNTIKSFLSRNDCALWYHNGDCDGCSEFGGRHLHVIIRISPTNEGSVPLLHNLTHYRTLRSAVEGDNSYVRSQRVRQIERLCRHLNTPPRVYMGSRFEDVGSLMFKLHSEYDTSIKLSSCVEPQSDDEDIVPIPARSDWYLDDTSTEDISNNDDRDKQSDNTTGCSRGQSTDTTIRQTGDDCGFPTYKLNQSDRTIHIIRFLIEKFHMYTFEELQDHINNLPSTDVIRQRWSTFQHRHGLANKVESVVQEIRTEWRRKPLTDMCDYFLIHCNNTLYDHLLNSVQFLRRWCCHNKLDVSFFVSVIDVLDRALPKRNSLTIIGDSNAGKTVMCQSPLQAICRFVGRVTNVNTAGQFTWQNCINVRLISVDEAMFAPEHMDKYKQISGGEKCIVDKKFSAPVTILPTPVILTANCPPWRMDGQQKEPLMNRTYLYRVKSASFLQHMDAQLHPAAWVFAFRVIQTMGRNVPIDIFWRNVDLQCRLWLDTTNSLDASLMPSFEENTEETEDDDESISSASAIS